MDDLRKFSGYYVDIKYDKPNLQIEAEIGEGFIVEGLTRITSYIEDKRIIIAFIDEDGELDPIGESADECTSWEVLLETFDRFISNLCDNFEIDKNIIKEFGER